MWNELFVAAVEPHRALAAPDYHCDNSAQRHPGAAVLNVDLYVTRIAHAASCTCARAACQAVRFRAIRHKADQAVTSPLIRCNSLKSVCILYVSIGCHRV